MKYVATCPGCSNEFNIPSELSALNGLQCPSCKQDFVPEKIHKVTSQEDIAWMRKRQAAAEDRTKAEEFLKIESRAFALEGLSLLLAVLAILVLILGVVAKLSDDTWGMYPVACSGMLSTAVFFFLVAQLLFIRAELVRIRLK
jgi:hypothetical protein